jgi:hypothetical protein
MGEDKVEALHVGAGVFGIQISTSICKGQFVQQIKKAQISCARKYK